MAVQCLCPGFSVWLVGCPCVSLCLLVSPCVSLCLPVSLCFSLCLLVSPCVSLCLLVSPCVSLCLLVSLCVSLCLPVSPCFSLCLPVSPCVCVSLHWAITCNLTLEWSPGSDRMTARDLSGISSTCFKKISSGLKKILSKGWHRPYATKTVSFALGRCQQTLINSSELSLKIFDDDLPSHHDDNDNHCDHSGVAVGQRFIS